MRFKQLATPTLLLLMVISVQAQSKLDSVRVYSIPFDFLNMTPISAARVKTFPITTSYVIVDSTKLSQIAKSLKSLKKSDFQFQVSDERMVCELYTGKRKRTLVINQVKYMEYRRKKYMPSDSLLNNLTQ
jgi:hypothetical protein